jgi:hypothetical protein
MFASYFKEELNLNDVSCGGSTFSIGEGQYQFEDFGQFGELASILGNYIPNTFTIQEAKDLITKHDLWPKEQSICPIKS